MIHEQENMIMITLDNTVDKHETCHAPKGCTEDQLLWKESEQDEKLTKSSEPFDQSLHTCAISPETSQMSKDSKQEMLGRGHKRKAEVKAKTNLNHVLRPRSPRKRTQYSQVQNNTKTVHLLEVSEPILQFFGSDQTTKDETREAQNQKVRGSQDSEINIPDQISDTEIAPSENQTEVIRMKRCVRSSRYKDKYPVKKKKNQNVQFLKKEDVYNFIAWIETKDHLSFVCTVCGYSMPYVDKVTEHVWRKHRRIPPKHRHVLSVKKEGLCDVRDFLARRTQKHQEGTNSSPEDNKIDKNASFSAEDANLNQHNKLSQEIHAQSIEVEPAQSKDSAADTCKQSLEYTTNDQKSDMHKESIPNAVETCSYEGREMATDVITSSTEQKDEISTHEMEENHEYTSEKYQTIGFQDIMDDSEMIEHHALIKQDHEYMDKSFKATERDYEFLEQGNSSDFHEAIENHLVLKQDHTETSFKETESDKEDNKLCEMNSSGDFVYEKDGLLFHNSSGVAMNSSDIADISNEKEVEDSEAKSSVKREQISSLNSLNQIDGFISQTVVDHSIPARDPMDSEAEIQRHLDQQISEIYRRLHPEEIKIASRNEINSSAEKPHTLSIVGASSNDSETLRADLANQNENNEDVIHLCGEELETVYEEVVEDPESNSSATIEQIMTIPLNNYHANDFTCIKTVPDSDKLHNFASTVPDSDAKDRSVDCEDLTMIDSFLLDTYHFSSQDNGNQRVECKLCDFSEEIDAETQCDIEKELVHHQKHRHKKCMERSSCMSCKRYFPSKLYLRHHIEKVHSKEYIPYKCEPCQMNFSEMQKYEMHMIRNHMDADKFQCPEKECDFVTTNARGLQGHLKIHKKMDKGTKHKEGMCELCGKVSSLKFGIAVHQARNCSGTIMRTLPDMSSANLFVCQPCQKVFPSENVLKIHEKLLHSGLNQCPFEGCTKAYKDVKTLSTHVNKEHYKKWQVSCPECGLAVADKSSLELHQKTVHRKLKEFMCSWPLCGKSFGRKSARDIHYRLHTGDAKFSCEYCDYKAKQRGSLNYHMKSKHPGRPYRR